MSSPTPFAMEGSVLPDRRPKDVKQSCVLVLIKQKTEASVPSARDSPREVELPKSLEKEPDPEWLIAEKEKAERNIAAHRQDRRQRDEMQEASEF